MTVATRNQPDVTSDTPSEYVANIDASMQVDGEVAGQFAPHEAATPDMTVVIDAGRLKVNGELKTRSQQTTVDFVAPSGNPRIDRIAINQTTGDYLIIEGTEAASPAAPEIPNGFSPCCQIELDNSPATAAITNSIITDERIAVVAGENVINWTFPESIAAFSISSVNKFSICRLTDNEIAIYDYNSGQLKVYKFNGQAWGTVGSGLTITGAGFNTALCQLNSTDVAFIDNTNEELRTYRWNGSTWSLVGSGLTITGIADPDLTELNSTDVAFIDHNTGFEELRRYRWNGSTWSLVGSALDLSSVNNVYPHLATLDQNHVVLVDSSNREIITYKWSGSNWSQLGNAFSLSGSPSEATITGINRTDISYCDGNNDELRIYRFNGSDWSLNGGIYALSTYGGFAEMAIVNGNYLAHVNENSGTLTMFRLNCAFGQNVFAP